MNQNEYLERFTPLKNEHIKPPVKAKRKVVQVVSGDQDEINHWLRMNSDIEIVDIKVGANEYVEIVVVVYKTKLEEEKAK